MLIISNQTIFFEAPITIPGTDKMPNIDNKIDKVKNTMYLFF